MRLQYRRPGFNFSCSPGEGNGFPLQCSCLENPMDIGAWWATVHGGRKESDMTERLSTYTHNLCRFSSECFLIVQNPLKCLLVVLVSFGCYNKLPQTRWPNVSEIYSLMVVVARCPKSRAMLPPEALEENIPLPLPALGGYWHSLGYDHISLSALSSHYLLLCVLNLPMLLSYKDTFVVISSTLK